MRKVKSYGAKGIVKKKKEEKFKSIATSFNLEDEYQRKVYDHVKSQSNSSWYLKNLAVMDMLKKENKTRQG